MSSSYDMNARVKGWRALMSENYLACKNYDELIEEYICDKASKSIKMLIKDCRWLIVKYNIITGRDL